MPSDGIDAEAAVDRPNRIFVTSTMFSADFGGLAGADAACQARATSAGLEGTFLAFLETTTILDPASRLAGSRGWVDLAGLPIADEAASLQAGTFFPLRVDETGAAVPHRQYAWRGGGGNATNPPDTTCMDWTSTVGTSNVHEISVDESFDTTTYSPCDMPRRLVCAEHGHVAPVTVSTQSGRIAFITEGLFTPGGGLTAADDLCSAEASAAFLPGSYRAFLTTATATPEFRFSAAGEPWRRVDGVRLTQTAAELLDPTHTFWETFIARTAKGEVTNQRVWVGTSADNCGNWINTTLDGSIGQSHSSDRNRLLLFPQIGCTSAFGLICLQE